MTSKIRQLLFTFIAIIFASAGLAQTKVSGTVLNASDRAPVSGASIVVKGTTRGTNTDAEGKFSIDVNPGESILVSSVGFTQSEVKVGKNPSLNISLESSTNELSNVVVVGYGTQKKTSLTNSVVQISGSDGRFQTFSNHYRGWHRA
jgi:hypothetical protein